MPDVAAWLTGVGVAVLAGIAAIKFILGRP
jgi:hypothetical protein